MQGIPGDQGPEGPRGPSDAFAYVDSTETNVSTPQDVAMLDLPTGFVVVNAKVQLNLLSDAGTTEAQCVLRVEDTANLVPTVFDVADILVSGTHIVVPLATAANLSDAGSPVAALNCTGANVSVSNVTLVAVQVGNLVRLP